MLKALMIMAGIAWLAVPVNATNDRWVTTYQVAWCPQTEQMMVIPIQLITNYSSPESEIGGVSRANTLDIRPQSATQNANLISLAGIDVRVLEHSAERGTVALVDLSNLSLPIELPNDDRIREGLVAHTVECVIVAARHTLTGLLTVTIREPQGDSPHKWKRFETAVDFCQDGGAFN